MHTASRLRLTRPARYLPHRSTISSAEATWCSTAYLTRRRQPGSSCACSCSTTATRSRPNRTAPAGMTRSASSMRAQPCSPSRQPCTLCTLSAPDAPDAPDGPSAICASCALCDLRSTSARPLHACAPSAHAPRSLYTSGSDSSAQGLRGEPAGVLRGHARRGRRRLRVVGPVVVSAQRGGRRGGGAARAT